VVKDVVTCKGIKTDNTPCTYTAKDNGYCGVHAHMADAQKPLF
jgi:hypothetical protein